MLFDTHSVRVHIKILREHVILNDAGTSFRVQAFTHLKGQAKVHFNYCH